jgi:hypothetical protein
MYLGGCTPRWMMVRSSAAAGAGAGVSKGVPTVEVRTTVVVEMMKTVGVGAASVTME